ICVGIYIFFRLGKIKSLYKELQESNRLVIIASEKAQESERMKNAFIKNMCHEVRTPLNAINGFAELITGEGVTPEEKEEFSKIIYTNCNNITSMMNDVLVIAQLDSNNDVLPLEPTHIDLLCRHEMSQLKKLQQKPDINYQVEGDKNNDLIYSDSNHFSIIISHLLNNAYKFTEKGSITLSYQTDDAGKTMCISVTDTGCGIPVDKSEWIFERFTKNDDFIPGSGLGLYLCRLIAQRLNGTLKLDTSYTGGARFVLRLPVNPYK
ncbi:sensor histidine kinase KdpD, partial [uncultured Parabacteroides sp.]